MQSIQSMGTGILVTLVVSVTHALAWSEGHQVKLHGPHCEGIQVCLYKKQFIFRIDIENFLFNHPVMRLCKVHKINIEHIVMY